MSKILIVEDEKLLSDSLVSRLVKEDFEVITASDGKEGLSKTKSEKPDLILLDLIMPIMDGATMLKLLRQDEATKDTPVIALTNLADENKMEEVMQSGGTDYLIKSDYSLEDLVKKIKERLNA